MSTIETRVPARLDRLPWSRFHWRVLIGSGDRGLVAIGFACGAAAMALGGIAELVFGVNAERRSLEDIAKPLTAAKRGRRLAIHKGR